MLKYYFYTTVNIPDDKVFIHDADHTQSMLVKYTAVSGDHDTLAECDDSVQDFIQFFLSEYGLEDECETDLAVNPSISGSDTEDSDEESWDDDRKLFIYTVADENYVYLTATLEVKPVDQEIPTKQIH